MLASYATQEHWGKVYPTLGVGQTLITFLNSQICIEQMTSLTCPWSEFSLLIELVLNRDINMWWYMQECWPNVYLCPNRKPRGNKVHVQHERTVHCSLWQNNQTSTHSQNQNEVPFLRKANGQSHYGLQTGNKLCSLFLSLNLSWAWTFRPALLPVVKQRIS